MSPVHSTYQPVLFISIVFFHIVSTAALFNHTDSFPTSDFISISVESSIRNLISINILFPSSLRYGTYNELASQFLGDVSFRSQWPYLHTGFESQWLAPCLLIQGDNPTHRATPGNWVHPRQVWTEGEKNWAAKLTYCSKTYTGQTTKILL